MAQGQRAAILTVSDGVFHGTRTDDSGRSLAELLTSRGFEIVETAVVADERPEIEAAIRRMAAVAQLVVTTGGTGLGPRDVTPEATLAAIDREAPGLAETMRSVGRAASPMAIISRGVTGVVGAALVLNLPGSPKGAVESLETVMDVVPHALQLLGGDTQHTPGQTALPADAGGVQGVVAAPPSAEATAESALAAAEATLDAAMEGAEAGPEEAYESAIEGAEAEAIGAGAGPVAIGAGAGPVAIGAGAEPVGHQHDHAGHEHTAPSTEEVAAARQRQAVDSVAAVGVGPTDVTLDLARQLSGGQQVLLATAIRTDGAPPCQPGQKLLIGPGGPLSGTLGCSEFDDSATADAAEVLASGRPVLRTYHHDLGSVEVYLEPYLQRPQLVVLAATPIALWLLRWGRDLGYETVLLESRSGWITPEHTAAATRVVADAAELAEQPGAEMEVVATDHEAPDVSTQVAALLGHKPRFVGIMGSARHTAGHIAELKRMGVPVEDVTRIQSPVGLNIGAKTPPEIALSILGGLIAARTGRPGGFIDNRIVK